ncbi:MAG TPA: lipopolysaccharide kinase InaA family protein [Thermoanaerobaculia bacterium]|nr:lipopolysaccharide kinase InaA family protein [Thermoanaerobaculia bacterium]
MKTLHWGRNYLYVSRLETAEGPVEVVVKQFRNRDFRDRLKRRWRGSKAARSWRVARALLAAGLETPEPVMLVESQAESGPSFYVCRYLPGVTEARYLFRAANAGTEAAQFPGVDFPAFVEALGRTLRRLHDAGFWHRDMSGGNVLLRFGDDGRPESLHLVDLNRTRIGKTVSVSERTRDLSRLALFRPEHQDLLLQSYWGAPASAAQKALYLSYHRSFLWKNETKKRVRGVTGKIKALVGPRTAHAHIPDAPAGAGARDQVVWDRLSDQPHQHAGRLTKLRVRLADARDHAGEAAVIAGALPRIWSRYRELLRRLHTAPVDFTGAGVCLRPWPEAPEAPLALAEELGAQPILLRLHPWEEDHTAEEELARELHARGYELTFALPQNRELVRDPARWRRALEEIGPRFAPYGPRFQIGQAINRSKWGIWTLRESVGLFRAAEEILRREPGVELLGPSVIDFEYHVAAAVLNLPRPGFRFDAVSALLYVDRRGAPENRQAGFDTISKVLLLQAIAETAKNAAGRTWITEVNWPLWEGPHSPAGKSVSVDEESQADYLVRYYLLALGTGGVERVFWWQMVARGYGLVDPADPASPRRRPSFHAFRTLLRELEGARLEQVLPSPEPARLYLFRKPGGEEIAVGWSAAGPAKATLPRPAVRVTGRDGEELPRVEGVEVEVTGRPRYFRL